MCQRVTCKTCGKPTFAGCGRHVESVLSDVPVEARCRCRETANEAEATPSKGRRTWLSALLSGPSGRRP